MHSNLVSSWIPALDGVPSTTPIYSPIEKSPRGPTNLSLKKGGIWVGRRR